MLASRSCIPTDVPQLVRLHDTQPNLSAKVVALQLQQDLAFVTEPLPQPVPPCTERKRPLVDIMSHAVADLVTPALQTRRRYDVSHRTCHGEGVIDGRDSLQCCIHPSIILITAQTRRFDFSQGFIRSRADRSLVRSKPLLTNGRRQAAKPGSSPSTLQLCSPACIACARRSDLNRRWRFASAKVPPSPSMTGAASARCERRRRASCGAALPDTVRLLPAPSPSAPIPHYLGARPHGRAADGGPGGRLPMVKNHSGNHLRPSCDASALRIAEASRSGSAPQRGGAAWVQTAASRRGGGWQAGPACATIPADHWARACAQICRLCVASCGQGLHSIPCHVADIQAAPERRTAARACLQAGWRLDNIKS